MSSKASKAASLQPLDWNETFERLASEGWRLLSQNVQVKSQYVDVWDREVDQGCGWQYLAFSTNNYPNTTLNLTPEPLKSAPGIGLLKELAANAKLIRRDSKDKPWFGHDWAIEIDGDNHFDSNFPSARLRDRALSETLLASINVDPDRSIVTFEIDRDGEQDEDAKEYPSVADHALSTLREVRSPTMRAWFSAMGGDINAFAQSISDGADLKWVNKSGDTLADAAGAHPEIVAYLHASLARETIDSVRVLSKLHHE